MVKTLKEFLGNNSIDYFSEKKTIESLMDLIGISDQKFTGIETTSKINDDRFSVIFNTVKDGHGNKGRHIIDVIFGEPTWQQMMDITFGPGRECGTKIAIFDDAVEMTDKVSNRKTAAKFASINNNCKVNTFVIAAYLTGGRENDIIDISYNIEASPDHGYIIDYRRCPSRDEFEKEEFWLYFDEYIDLGQERIYDPNWWFGGPVNFLIEEVIDVYPIWNVDGFFMRVSADNFPGHKILVKLIETKRIEIEKHFKGYDLNISKIPDCPIEISVKYDDRPYKAFVQMNIREKKKCAKNCRKIEGEFRGFFEELIEDIDETEKN
jgi:hypothetical protein